MRYKLGKKKPDHDSLARRLVNELEICILWDDIEPRYGSKLTKQLKERFPSDPYLLYDLTALSLISEGKRPQDEVLDILDGYTPKEWEYEFKMQSHMFDSVINMYKPKILKAIEEGKKDGF